MNVSKKNTNRTSLSKSNDKKSELLIKVDELMEKLDNDYGPLLLGELQKRLESTIEEFHIDLKDILEKSFKNYDTRFEKGIQESSNNSLKTEVPTFIAEYEKKKKNKK